MTPVQRPRRRRLVAALGAMLGTGVAAIVAAQVPDPASPYAAPSGEEGRGADEVVEAEPVGSAADARPAEAPSHEVEDLAARVQIEVFVGTRGADFLDTPLADADVVLHVVDPPHELVSSTPGRTDAEGRVQFAQTVHPTHEAWVELRAPERQFSDAIPLRDPGRRAITLRARPSVSDPTVVRAARLITLMEPWEGFVIVQQVWNLTTDGDVVYRADTTDPGPGMAARLVQIPLPPEAKGIQVLQPADGSRVLGTTVFFGGEVRPAEPDGTGTTQILLQYSLPLDGPSITWEQPLSLPIADISVLLPGASRHRRHQRMGVTLDVPLCEGMHDSTTVCFQEIARDMSGMNVHLGADVVVARGGRANTGATLRVHSDGWPWRRPWERWIGGVAFAAALLASGGLVAREAVRRRSGARDQRERELEGVAFQIQALLRTADALARARALDELLPHEHEDALAQLHERLAILYRRQRVLRGDEQGSSSNEPS